MKIYAALGVVVAVMVGSLLYRKSLRSDELEAARQEEEKQARQQVDLSALPPIETAPPEKPQVKFKKKPIAVELKLKTKKGKPFTGKYRLVNASGDIVGQDDALGAGAPAVFIVTPGYYELIFPGTKFRKALTLVGDDSGKMSIEVVVAAK